MIAIIDDEQAARDELEFLVNKYLNKVSLVKMTSGRDFLDFKDKDKLSIIFLDIHLGDIDGLEIAKTIKELNNDAIIVLVSAYDKYALLSYEVGVFDYITKPIVEERFEKLIERINRETSILKSKKLSISSNKTTYVINVEDIIYIEFAQRKTFIVTAKENYNTNVSLSKLLSILPTDSFFRAHKSYIVNINFIESIEQAYTSHYDINIIGLAETKIPVSRTKTKELKSLLNII